MMGGKRPVMDAFGIGPFFLIFFALLASLRGLFRELEMSMCRQAPSAEQSRQPQPTLQLGLGPDDDFAHASAPRMRVLAHVCVRACLRMCAVCASCARAWVLATCTALLLARI